jgi:hypothetical protein
MLPRRQERPTASGLTFAWCGPLVQGRVGDTPFGLRAKEEGFISRPGEAIDDVAVVIMKLD